MINDPRVARFGGDGYEVTTTKGVYRVLNAGVMGWGVYTGPNLDLAFTPAGALIGAADPEELIRMLLKTDNNNVEA